MAYISEEIEKTSLGIAMGLYISGNSIGGMGGRIIIGFLTDVFHWRIALGSIGVIGVAASLLFWMRLPASRHFEAREFQIGKLLKTMGSHLKNPGLLGLYCIGFLLMGSFVSLYNYIGFQLIAPPYSMDPALVSFIFVIYIVGTFSSTWMGRLADNHGHHKVLRSAILLMFIGAATTLNAHLALKIFGIALLTFGFFGGHSIVSSWVGRLASHDRAQASSLYLFFYYTGSSVGGTSAGIFWTNYGWSGVISMIACFLISAFLLTTRLSSK
jgi:YNFM family putative membrane transporter